MRICRERYAPRTTVFVLSDHGFKAVKRQIRPNAAFLKADAGPAPWFAQDRLINLDVSTDATAQDILAARTPTEETKDG